jgi:hypothetical protein
MTKATQTFGLIGLFLISWLAILYGQIPGLVFEPKIQSEIIPVVSHMMPIKQNTKIHLFL